MSYDDLIGNKGGLTPILFAARQGHVESVLALLGAGVDINQTSGDHTSPLLMATINGQLIPHHTAQVRDFAGGDEEYSPGPHGHG